MIKLRRQKWILGIFVTITAVSLGAGCGGDDADADLGSGGASTGGTLTGTGGTLAGTGGESSTGGGGVGAADAVELVNEAGWIDDVQGIRGSFYAYGDGITCMTAEGNPCSTGACCLDWTTVVDGTFVSWGCGIGMELNSDGGEPAVKSPYTGTEVVGFRVTVTGDVPAIRLGYTQQADTTDTVSPFAIQESGSGTYDVLFSETVCPSWGAAQGCVDDAVATSSHDLQLQVVGGEVAGSGSLCITSVQPILAS